MHLVFGIFTAMVTSTVSVDCVTARGTHKVRLEPIGRVNRNAVSA
uniref:Uncharacterized protein n=1 Tax=Anguilla anguilla TaxID=7936 RepID=A0A0E9SLD3_ANGAN